MYRYGWAMIVRYPSYTRHRGTSAQLNTRLQQDCYRDYILFKVLEFLNVEALVPAHVNEHLDASIKLEQGLRRGRRGLRA